MLKILQYWYLIVARQCDLIGFANLFHDRNDRINVQLLFSKIWTFHILFSSFSRHSSIIKDVVHGFRTQGRRMVVAD